MSNKNDYRVEVQQILLGYYIKYSKLQELVEQTLYSTNAEMVDVYIDLYDMLYPLYSTNIYSNKKFIITSSVINLAAHMREYFWSRHRVISRIFLVYADGSLNTHKEFCYNFGNNDMESMMNYDKTSHYINSQLDLVKILAAYINGVYFVRKETDFAMFTYDNICKNLNIPAVILTKDKYNYQIPAMCNNAVIFRPKKYNGDDISFAITNNNVILSHFNKINREDSIMKLKDINSAALSLLYALTGLPKKKLLTLFNSTTAINMLHQAIQELKIINGYNMDIPYVYKALNIPSSKIDPINFEYRFRAVDMVYQHRIYSGLSESIDVSWFIDLNDPKTVQHINNTYFIDNPLDLNSL